MKTRLSRIGTVAFLVGWFSLATCFAIDISLGGSAISGKVDGNHYYLRDHQRLTEVSRRQWRLVQIVERVAFSVFPVGLMTFAATMIYEDRMKKRALNEVM